MDQVVAAAAAKKRPQERATTPGWWLLVLIDEIERERGENLTRRRIAAICDVDKSTVQRWVSTTIPHLTWLGILHAFDVKRGWQPPRGMTEEKARALGGRDDEGEA